MITLAALVLLGVLSIFAPASVGLGSLDECRDWTLFMALLALLFFLVSLGLYWLKHSSCRGLMLASVIALVIFAVTVIRNSVYEWGIAEAKTPPDQLLPGLEKFRHDHGAYPAKLSDLNPRPAVPWMLSYEAYKAYGNKEAFAFYIDNPRVLISFGSNRWVYESDYRHWEYERD